MKTLNIAAGIIVIGVLTYIIVDMMKKKYGVRKQDRVDAFGSNEIPVVLKGVNLEWEKKVKAETKEWIMTSESFAAATWKEAIEAEALKKGITFNQAMEGSLKHGWDVNTFKMFSREWQTSPDDSWKFYWVINWLNENAAGYGINNAILFDKLEQIQNQ